MLALKFDHMAPEKLFLKPLYFDQLSKYTETPTHFLHINKLKWKFIVAVVVVTTTIFTTTTTITIKMLVWKKKRRNETVVGPIRTSTPQIIFVVHASELTAGKQWRERAGG